MNFENSLQTFSLSLTYPRENGNCSLFDGSDASLQRIKKIASLSCLPLSQLWYCNDSSKEGFVLFWIYMSLCCYESSNDAPKFGFPVELLHWWLTNEITNPGWFASSLKLGCCLNPSQCPLNGTSILPIVFIESIIDNKIFLFFINLFNSWLTELLVNRVLFPETY